MRRLVEVVPTESEARKIRETFTAKPSKKRRKMPWGWPSELVHAGRCLAVMYTSDKWHRDGDFEDYKHIAEAPQDLLVDDHELTLVTGRNKLALKGDRVELRAPMPGDIAELAPLLGFQAKLTNGGLVEVEIAHAILGGARHPETHEPFLVIYKESATGVLALITGRELDVERDGIVG